MGRKIKRVPVDFDWPLKTPWKGYINPYCSRDCKPCDSSGLNPETKKISDDWYDFSNSGRRWCNNITQDEVEALVENNRLWDFTRDWIPGKGWIEKEPSYIPTADEVNRWSRGGLGHDGLNQWICVEARARRMGVWGHCLVCNGEGVIWFNDQIRELYESWYETERYDPPTGEGYQLWETVSEGSPISPVFETVEMFRDYLINELGYSRSSVEKFLELEWSPSMAGTAGNIKRDIESL